MGNMSPIAKFNNRQPKVNSKRQKELKENPEIVHVIGCNKCHSINVTLKRGKDSYYCINCYNKLPEDKR